jgi:glycosyltransferase involved in cell wall biosynthesis
VKYWLLTTEFPPFHGGGISTYCYFAAQLLTRLNFVVTVFVPDEAVEHYTISDNKNFRVISFNPLTIGRPGTLGYTANLSYSFAQIIKAIIEQEGKPHFIESQDYLGIAYYITQYRALDYSFLRNVHLLITLHSPAFIYLEYNRIPTYAFPEFWTCEMEKHSLIAADLLLAPTRYIVNEIRKYVPLSEKKVKYIPNPYERVEEVKESSIIQGKIVYYGKLSSQKGSFELLKYFRKLWDEGLNYPLHLVGDTTIVYHPEMKTMGELVADRYQYYIQKGLLQLHGKISPEQSSLYLADAHIIIVPSLVDNLPYVVMEAMSLGKIVLASVQGGQSEMIEDGVTGFLFDHTVTDSFVEKLKYILAMPIEVLHAMGQRARLEVGKKYSFGTIGPLKQAVLAKFAGSFPVGNRFPFLYQEPIQLPKDNVHSVQNLLSVVIPYFNMGRYIEAALTSVFASTWKNIEVIVINDGSTEDDAVKKLNELKLLPGVRVIHRPNYGLAETRNHGANVANGEFLAFLDADDQVEGTYYEKAIRVLMKKTNVFFVGAWVKYFENSNRTWPTFTPQPPYALIHNPVNSSALVYKRAAFLAGGLNDEKVGYGLEDYEGVVNMLHHGFNGVVLPEILFRYRVRSGSMFRRITKEKFLHAYKYIAEKHHSYFSRFALSITHLLNANGPGFLFDNPTQPVKVFTIKQHEGPLVQQAKSFLKRHQRLKKLALMIKRISS